MDADRKVARAQESMEETTRRQDQWVAPPGVAPPSAQDWADARRKRALVDKLRMHEEAGMTPIPEPKPEYTPPRRKLPGVDSI